MVVSFLSALAQPISSWCMNKISDGPTLVITEFDGLLQKGSCINFVIQEGSIKFEMNSTNVQKRQLKTDPRIRELALRGCWLNKITILIPQSIVLKPVYFWSTSGIVIPVEVWLFSSNAATIRGNAKELPLSVCANMVSLLPYLWNEVSTDLPEKIQIRYRTSLQPFFLGSRIDFKIVSQSRKWNSYHHHTIV